MTHTICVSTEDAATCTLHERIKVLEMTHLSVYDERCFVQQSADFHQFALPVRLTAGMWRHEIDTVTNIHLVKKSESRNAKCFVFVLVNLEG